MKDKYILRVKELLSKNYKNFEDLVKNDSKFKKFMKIYASENKMKKQNISEVKMNSPAFYLEFYAKSNNFFAEIKGFFDYVIIK